MRCPRWSVQRRFGVTLGLMAALSLRADVLVLNNGGLLLGRVRGMTDAEIEVALGAAGSTTVRKTDMKLLIPGPPEEEPDSYLKAGLRAEQSGLVAEALACYEKSLAVEPANAVAATSRRAALQQQRVGDAWAKRSAAPANSMEAQRAEAQRLIHEGEQIIARAKVAASFRSPNSGGAEQSVASWSASLQAQGEEMKRRGERMLAQLGGQPVPSGPAPASPPAPSTPAAAVPQGAQAPATATGDSLIGWLKIGGIVGLGLIVLRLLLHPFFSRD
ncbi:MAG: hypothetical protein N2689_15315 [Verrucomicrobiae bacterium]|nr:hypothetical protein [Verrucomicrobiae bacterium]